MYKLIIVDDDVHVLEGFRRKVDWASLNVEIVGTADNGLDGLEIIKELKPDIVMTDIKMPLMDGVGLMKKIQELDQNIKVVVLSGFGEFEFAKQAMKYNAVDYLLKPTSKEEVSQLTTKLVRMLDEERHEKSVLASHRLLSKLKNQSQPESYQELLSSVTGTKISGGPVAVMVIKPGKSVQASDISPCIESSTETMQSVVLHWDESTWIVLFLGYKTAVELGDDIYQIAIKFRENFKKLIYNKVRLAIGGPVESTGDLKLSLDSALDLMNFRTVTDENLIITPSGQDESFRDFSKLRPLAKAISININKGDKDSAISSISSFFDKASRIKQYSRRFYNYILAVSFKSISMCRKLPEELLESQSEYRIWQELTSKNSIRNLERYVVEHCREALSNSDKKRNQSYTAPVKFVIKKIADDYKESLLIKDIASSLYISDNYLTTLFKKETGTSFKKYLTAYRMQKAKEYLENPRFMIQEIAEMVGYKSEEHFSKTFKTTTGLSPKKYRTSIIYKTDDDVEM